MYYDLGRDPGEHNNLFPAKLDGGWMFELFLPYSGQLEKSFAEYPNIKPGEEFQGYPAKM